MGILDERAFVNNTEYVTTSLVFTSGTGFGAVFDSAIVAAVVALLTTTAHLLRGTFDDGNGGIEIVYLTTTDFTSVIATRGQEGTSVVDWPVGSKMTFRLTKGSMQDISDAVNQVTDTIVTDGTNVLVDPNGNVVTI